MITLINGTNRPENKTIMVTNIYQQLLQKNGIEHHLLNLASLNSGFLINQAVKPNAEEENLQYQSNVYQFPKMIFIVPEYNGSVPGICKLFIDGLNPSRLNGKKAALVGVSSGRSGNLRGLDHLTGILNYLGIDVLSMKVNIPGINQYISNNNLNSDSFLPYLDRQLKRFIDF